MAINPVHLSSSSGSATSSRPVQRWQELERSLVLSATTSDAPGPLLQQLGHTLTSFGGMIRAGSKVSESCADLDFAFQRHCSMEVYGALLGAGLHLDRGAHRQLADLCHCSHALPSAEASSYARIHLTAYTATAAATFLGKLRVMSAGG